MDRCIKKKSRRDHDAIVESVFTTGYATVQFFLCRKLQSRGFPVTRGLFRPLSFPEETPSTIEFKREDHERQVA